jgi:urease accessory protein
MKRIFATAAGTLVVLAFTSATALAHPHHHHGEAAGFMPGFLHPLTGLDHILAMVAVGIWAALVGGRALIAWPAAFIVAMSAAALVGMAFGEMPVMEIGIALSVVVLGIAVALRASASLALGAAVVGLFAIFHGYAHGAELPAETGALGYVAGFALATALLHAAGLGFGSLIGRMPGVWVSRVAGAGVAAIGLVLLVV